MSAIVVDFEKIRIDADDDFIFMSMKLYKFFMAKQDEGGWQAKELYEHYMFTARLQGEYSIKANDTYIQNGLGWGKEKIKKSKAFLKKYGLIDYKANKNAEGKIVGWYIIIKTTGSFFKPLAQETTPLADHAHGFETQIPDKSKEIPDKSNRNRGFVKPDLPEVTAYMLDHGGTEQDATAFFNYYESVGWFVGKKKMVSWKGAASGWLNRKREWGPPKTQESSPLPPLSERIEEMRRRGLLRE